MTKNQVWLGAVVISSGMLLWGCGGGSSCGDVAQGGACLETADCACDLSCLQGTCAKSFGTPGVEPWEDEGHKTYPQTSVAKGFCDSLASQPCAPESVDRELGECYSEWSQSHGKAKDAGCGSPFVTALDCIADHLDCAQGGDLGTSMEIAMRLTCRDETMAVSACARGLDDGCAGGGSTISCSTELAEDGQSSGGCTVGAGNGCGTANASCTLVDESEATQYKCVCGEGQRPGEIFYGYASSCCDIDSYLAEACGYVTP